MPAYYDYTCLDRGHKFHRYRNIKKCPKCGSKNIRREESGTMSDLKDRFDKYIERHKRHMARPETNPVLALLTEVSEALGEKKPPQRKPINYNDIEVIRQRYCHGCMKVYEFTPIQAHAGTWTCEHMFTEERDKKGRKTGQLKSRQCKYRNQINQTLETGGRE